MQILLDEDDSIDERGGRSGGTRWHTFHPNLTQHVVIRLLVDADRDTVDTDWCQARASLDSPMKSRLASWHTLLFFFFAHMHAHTLKKPLPCTPSCLPLSRKNVLLDEGTALRLTNVCVCVHVSDWPCLGRPTQHHNSHDWVFSHCASQQTTAAHTAASADWVTVILQTGPRCYVLFAVLALSLQI